VLQALAATPRLLVCCDFDGTLSHLVDHPGAARPVPGAVAVLDALGELPDTWVAVISGRELSVLAAVSAMPAHVQLVGSHGTEFEPAVIAALGPDQRRLLGEVIALCRDIAADTPGTLIESKPASVAVHVRNVPRDRAPGLLARIRVGPGSLPGVSIIEGKEVIEIGVVLGGKGTAVDELRSRHAATATVFIGDDVTDEDAFAVLSAGDVGVKVGSGDTAARWRVGDPDDVVRLLHELLLLRRTTPSALLPADPG
jgi:trehalose-phosphatase